MSEQAIRARGAIDLPALMPWLVALAVYLLLTLLADRLLNDPDTYLHIALGRFILVHHVLPDVDPFTETQRGTAWAADEWLAQVAYALVYNIGGWFAVTALTAAAAATAFGQLTRCLLQRWQPVPTLVGVLAALTLTAPHILARPHVLALPLLVIWIAALIQAADTARAPSWRLLPLMTIWANLHGSFLFGLAMTGLIMTEAIWVAPASHRLDVAKRWSVFALLAFAAACLNPYGLGMILAALRTLALGQALSLIIEWRPQDFSKIGAYELIVLAAAALALWRGVRLPAFRIVMLLGVLHLSLAQSRHADLLGMLAALFLARPLAGQFPALAADRVSAVRQSLLPVAGGLLMAAALTAYIGDRTDVNPAAAITPANAVHALAAAGTGPILNSYEFGGYLDFIGIAPFIDGRAELYGKAFMLRYYRAVTLQDLPGFLHLLDEYHVERTLLTANTPAVALLDRLPGWQRVYADDIAVVHARRTAQQ